MTIIYIDTEKLEKDVPVFGIICSGLNQERFSHKVTTFKHPISSNKSYTSDKTRPQPVLYSVDFFIGDNPQTLREQIEFIGSADFWKGLISDYGRIFEEATLKDSGLRTGQQNSFSSFIYQNIVSMLGYEVIVVSSTGEIKNMIIEDVDAIREKNKRGMNFNLTLSKIFRVKKETTTETTERTYNPKKSDTKTNTKTADKKGNGKLQEVSALGSLTGYAQ